MKVEFRKAEVPEESRALAAFDAKVFSKTERFPASVWREFESHWMLVDGRKVGCCAFDLHQEPGELQITSTAIHPRYQGQGFGRLLKAWQVAYAIRHGVQRLVTYTRRSNARMIALNRKFGFRIARVEPDYYDQPAEDAIVMVLRFSGRRGAR